MATMRLKLRREKKKMHTTSIDVFIMFKLKKPPIGLSHHSVHVTVFESEMVEVIKAMKKAGYKAEHAIRRTNYQSQEDIKP